MLSNWRTRAKRLIEVDLPIRLNSAHARRENGLRHWHFMTLRIWWARQPYPSDPETAVEVRFVEAKGVPDIHVVQDPARLGWKPVVNVEHYHVGAQAILLAEEIKNGRPTKRASGDL